MGIDIKYGENQISTRQFCTENTMHSEQITRTDFDFILRFRISAGLLLRALERKDLLAGKRIAIIEPRLTRTNDKLCKTG